MPTTTSALRRTVSLLRDVLTHDCDPRSEHCYCFGAGDIAAYETARLALSEQTTELARYYARLGTPCEVTVTATPCAQWGTR